MALARGGELRQIKDSEGSGSGEFDRGVARGGVLRHWHIHYSRPLCEQPFPLWVNNHDPCGLGQGLKFR